MKKVIILLLCAIFSNNSSFAQDVIVKKDGSTILSKVIEVGSSEIKYKKIGKPDGPLYSINVSDVLSVNYESGEKESFENVVKDDNKKDIAESPIKSNIQEYTLPAGTLIPIQNANYTKAAVLSVGQSVDFRVARDVIVGNVNIVPYGTVVRGIVYQAKKSSWFGTKGRLGIKINEIALPNGNHIPLTRGDVYVTGKNRTPLSVLLFLFVTWPACFITGSKAELHAGYEISAEVARPVVFQIENGMVTSRTYEMASFGQPNEKQNLDAKEDAKEETKERNATIYTKHFFVFHAIIINEDEKYYYYKDPYSSKLETKKIKKSRVKLIKE